MTKKPAIVDGSLGPRIRARRRSIGITQAELAAAIGVSFQQVQKYEKGTSAVAASRLEQICDILNLPPTFFTDTDPALIGKPARSEVAQDGSGARLQAIDRFVQSGEGRRLLESFIAISSERLRVRILEFISAIADDQSLSQS